MANDPRQLQFWDDEEDELWDAIQELIVMTLTDGSAEGLAMLPANLRVLADFDLVNQDVLNFVKTYRYEWIKKITDTTRTQVQQALADWIQEGSPLDALESRLEPIFGQARAEMIAATEVTRVYAEGNKAAWESTGIVSQTRWQTAVDDLVCDICGPMDGQITEETPPAHVNCRCWLLPVVDEAAVKAKFEQIFS